ncbi:M14 family metallopeptidase [Paenibacillus radicis (ex Xue et al. 2023)]|uniref:M14 family metallopeptidase n=1 Tax=Paenibacillus radicis (ex Xue et al. 2023) TaxID=2972489 RepID=A0ABT1YD00_9BACL|nr:M14 family metallopeptidase [Paenibacillus radicis (ex Xue et al. 2023)]MCR8631052.1 M14 family metallopeptidase [Paenibacillus radicis (ex Xue et al. 2023)]
MICHYVVQSGDTVFRIARHQGTNVIALYSLNPQLMEQGYVYPGQVLQIPPPAVSLYVIQAGDTTLFELACRLAISLESLVAANPQVDPDKLPIGQTIVLPHNKKTSIIQTNSEYGYKELIEDLELLSKRYPFLQMGSIGSSVLGRSIPVIRLGNGPKQLHYNGAFHANEWITTLLLMKFIEEYAEVYRSGNLFRGRDIQKIFEQSSLWIVPMVNPDGVELVHVGAMPDNPYYEFLLKWNFGCLDFSGWKSNIRGVDLNDQFPAGWERERDRREVTGPGPRDYTSTAPLSEPEAKAMADFTNEHDFRLVIAFHTQGQEIYWNYGDMEPPEAEQLAKRLAKVSRYRAVKLQGSDAGYKDWFIQQFRRPGFTVETGFGVNPLPLSQFRSMYDEVIGIMLEGLVI